MLEEQSPSFLSQETAVPVNAAKIAIQRVTGRGESGLGGPQKRLIHPLRNFYAQIKDDFRIVARICKILNHILTVYHT